MNYELQHAHTERTDDRWFQSLNVRLASDLPRVGDSIDLDGMTYEVVHVWHPVTREQKPGDAYGGLLPVVRVK